MLRVRLARFRSSLLVNMRCLLHPQPDRARATYLRVLLELYLRMHITHMRHAQQTTAAAAPQPQQQRPSLPLTTTQASPTQPLPPATPTMGDRLPQPLQHAVQQLSQQRSAVIQAVQTRAQRALQGRRSDEVVNEGNILSPPRALLGPRR